MEYFNEIKNSYYSSTRKLINDFYYNSMTYDKMKLQNFYMKNVNNLSGSEFGQEFFEELTVKGKTIKELLLLKESNGEFYPAIDDIDIPIMLTGLEKRYIKMLLNDKQFSYMLSRETYNKLESALENVKPLNCTESFVYTDVCSEFDDTTVMFNKISILTKAIKDHSTISYLNNAKNGKVYKFKAKPYRFLFSLKSKKWQVILVPEKETVDNIYPILANVERLSNIEICEDSEGSYSDGKELIEQKKSKESLVLVIRDKYTSLERCFRMFSDYEKNAFYSEQTGLHHLTLQYYSFDEAIIIKDILSLGDAVEVITPESIRAKIIERISKIPSHSF